jgi:hypothetical protein
MLSILDAATVVVITGALLYYEGWLFMWLLRRQYAAHASDIDSPRELFLVIGAWSLNWYPFYILAIVGGTVLYLSDILTSGSMAAVPVMTFVAILLFYFFHKLTFSRARTVFLGSAHEGFAFFPEVEALYLTHEGQEDSADQVNPYLRDRKYRVLSIDRSKVILFCPEADDRKDMIATLEIPRSELRALRVVGTSHFSGLPQSPPWTHLLPDLQRLLQKGR